MNRRIIFILSLLLVAVHLLLMVVKGSIGRNFEDALFGLFLCLLPAFPILALSFGQVSVTMPRIVIAVAAVETALTLWLFFNVYFIPEGSTIAIGLVTIPVFLLALNGILAVSGYVWKRRKNGG